MEMEPITSKLKGMFQKKVTILDYDILFKLFISLRYF